jgi:hypothetical protein
MSNPKSPPGVSITTIRTAELLIERHGDGALSFAEEQVRRFALTGGGTLVDWEAVVSAIKEILARGGKA